MNKHITYSPLMIISGTEYRLNVRPSGVYSSIMKKTIEQLNFCEKRWNKVLVVMAVLHINKYQDKNTQISKFRKNLNKKIERIYGITQTGYVWVREFSQGLHFHFAIMLDGNKAKNSNKIYQLIQETWSYWRGNGASNKHGKNKWFHVVNDKISKIDAIYHLSYFAKVSTKDKGRKPTVNDYGTSRLKGLQS